MSSILSRSLRPSAWHMAPPSTVIFSSRRKQVVRNPNSSPPWQPRTRTFMKGPPLLPRLGVAESFFHLEELKVLPHLGQVVDHGALGHQRDQPRLDDLGQRVVDLFEPQAHARMQLAHVAGHQVALRRLLAAPLGLL